MAKIQNASRGTRVVHVKHEQGHRAVLLEPGQSVENVEVVNPEDPVFQGMVEKRELIVDGGKQTRRQAEARLEEVTKRQGDLQGELEKLNAERQVLETALNEKLHQNDPKFRDDRQAAMIAGNTPGYADPLPRDTNRDSDPKVLEAQGHDPEEVKKADPARGGIDAQKAAPYNPFSKPANSPPKSDAPKTEEKPKK
jgi:hypothetical protein